MLTCIHDNVPTHDSIDHMFDMRYYEMIVLITNVEMLKQLDIVKPFLE